MIIVKEAPTFSEAIAELSMVLHSSLELSDEIRKVGDAIIQCLKKGGKIFTCGNGGSAADALHMAEEFVGRYKKDRRALPAVCLNADVTAITCIGNDYGFDQIFARQVLALGNGNDLLVAFSTSGNSPNIVSAFSAAKNAGIKTILLGGKGGGAAASQEICDHKIIISSNNTARIQETHTLILHCWLESVDAIDWEV